VFSLPTFLIGLREGLEASLVVGILVAYLVKSGKRDRLGPLWLGVLAAIVLSMAFGAVLQFTSASMSFEQQEAFGGFASLVAVGFVTWMVFWMRRTSRFLKRELHGKLDAALALGPLALALTGFIAVGREGLETALFLWSAIQSTQQAAVSTTSAFAGLLVSALLGWAFYRGAVQLNLKTFFSWTGGALVVVAAGVAAYGVHDLQEAGIVGGINDRAFDISDTIPPSSWYGTLLKGVFNFQPNPTWLQVCVWLAYLVPVLVFFLRPAKATPAGASAPKQRVAA
jgi:high-affinity iron transporter